MSLMMTSKASPLLPDGLGEIALVRRQRRVEQKPAHADNGVHGAYGFRGSSWPGRRSWPGSPPRRQPLPRAWLLQLPEFSGSFLHPLLKSRVLLLE